MALPIWFKTPSSYSLLGLKSGVPMLRVNMSARQGVGP